MDEITVYVGGSEAISISFDHIYYKNEIQEAIDKIFEFLNYEEELKNCVLFISNNSNLLDFMIKAVSNKIVYFLNEDNVNKLIDQYARDNFGELPDILLKRFNKSMAVTSIFSNMLKEEIFKVKPLMKNLDKQIIDVLK